MPPTIRYKYKYFHSAVQRAKDRRQKFHFCRLRFDVRPRNVKLNLSIGLLPTLILWDGLVYLEIRLSGNSLS